MAEMRYRTVPRTGDEVGIIGMGTSSNGAAGVEETVRTVRMALDAGTATMPARSMWTRFPGWPRYASASDEGSWEGPHSGPGPSYPGIRNAHPARSPTRSTDGGLRPKDLPAEIRSLSI